MNKQLVEMMDAIEAKKQEGQVFLNEGKKEELIANVAEIKNMKEQLELANHYLRRLRWK
ncbi:hypothetical protein [Peribacillus frigoritolerans]|uniref:hypothetical protein n=1 Tax=Peribacillus castrilensis TaxID=2897690 RepID=UPI003DA6BACF